MAKGGEAAALATGSFIAAFATIEPDCPLAERLERSCIFANRAVFNLYRGEAGTTLTAIAFANHARCAVHVGDSRLYGIDETREIELLTKDDTVLGAVNAHLGQAGEDEMDNRLLQFVGIGESMLPSIINVESDNEHHLWLLTSDGAHSVGRKTLSGISAGCKSPYDLVRKIVYVSEAINTQDNATAICIRSGYVGTSRDEHEGLTIQITAPDRNLEIWLPTTVMQLAISPADLDAEQQGSSSSEPTDTFNGALPVPVPPKKRIYRGKSKKSALKSLRRKSTSKSEQADAEIEEMNFIFEAGSDDND